MTRVLVTGGAGFIGSHFIKLALRRHPDWHIVNLDNLTYAGNPANLPTDPRHEFIKGDIADAATVNRVFEPGFELVVNLAAETHVDRSLRGAADFIRTDVLGTHTLLAAARQHQVAKFIQISTDEVYGSLQTGRATEESPLRPANPYAASKAAADLVALTAGVPVIITRCTNNYGPNQHVEKFIPLCITNALDNQPLPVYGDGRNIRDWIHVEDHCAAIDHVIEHGTPGEIYNIAGGNELENITIARQICRILAKPESLIKFVTDRPGHDRRYALNADKLGWKPQRPFDLTGTVEWYRANEAWWRKVKSGEFRQYYQQQYGQRL
ncbi:MAG: dTDP-glucose 4,6-dehydratase [Verrucomicrobiae bacterium]|nr:dTDP-glucose 4,6-dehydratase [Verrucomicrobiae bacterium]